MKPATYTELVSAVQAYAKRSDIIATDVDYLITEVEEELNARLRTRQQLTNLTPTVSSAGSVTLPADFAGWKRFVARDSSTFWELEPITLESQEDVNNSLTGSGKPATLYTLATAAQIWPYTDGVYTFRAFYFSKIPNLTSGAPTNWVLTNFPMVYVYGCLAAMRAYVMDDERIDRWVSMFNRSIDRIEMVDAKERDARTHARLTPNTTMFPGRGAGNIMDM